ncbi:diacylglycerol/lipid kinase family protein [Fictibacillus aquaticus]|uniref:Diacylglycerol kinase n=1 Tax=Fictibacillus aquaticus TaxID=2021314 RepID=A0A235FFD2_9BACL|nr:diacylglycerol kinase family protein [Fictibacillus aquaticus]OYD59703.1 diacylglycerol kinase [Fictibacillus aquaticus]
MNNQRDHAVIIHNPKAGNKLLHEQLPEIQRILQESFSAVTIKETIKGVPCKQIVEEACSDGGTIIGAGGDGTIYNIINAIAGMEERPLFGILPGGTCNDFSRALGMQQNPLEAARQIAEKRLRKVDAGKNNDHYFMNFWGIGLITSVSENIDPELKDKFGRLSYYWSAAQTLQQWEPFHLNINSPDFQYSGDATMLMIANGPFTGGIKPFFPNADLQDGKFDVLLIKEPSLKIAWEIIQSRFTENLPEGEGFFSFQTDQLKIDAEPVQHIDCDGEKEYKTPSMITCLKQHLEVYTGDVPF